MSPRAAWRLEALGFEHVADYVGGKLDWIAHGLPREGETTDTLYTGEVVDGDPPTCALTDTVSDLQGQLAKSGSGFVLVVNEHRIVLGRVRRSMLDGTDETAAAESVMEPGPSTVRPNTPVGDLVERLSESDLRTAIVTTPNGCLVGVFHRAEAERRLR